MYAFQLSLDSNTLEPDAVGIAKSQLDSKFLNKTDFPGALTHR